MVRSDALLISLCPLIFPCCVCALSWQAQASVLQPEGRNKQAPLGEMGDSQEREGELQNNRIKMGRRVQEAFGSVWLKPEVCDLWIAEMESKMRCVYVFSPRSQAFGSSYMQTYTFPKETGTKTTLGMSSSLELIGLLECMHKAPERRQAK